ncbi:MAG: DMP19 family protein [Tepidisphaeraceae bacterium]
MDWHDTTSKYHERTFDHESRLSALPCDWQRELAALWRLEADMNNGAYLQFLANWGRESYVHASQALKKIGAHTMADIIDRCQALVDEHFTCEGQPPGELRQLLPNPAIDSQGNPIKDVGSVLPKSVVTKVHELSYQFMNYPDDIAQLGLSYYRSYFEGNDPDRTQE